MSPFYYNPAAVLTCVGSLILAPCPLPMVCGRRRSHCQRNAGRFVLLLLSRAAGQGLRKFGRGRYFLLNRQSGQYLLGDGGLGHADVNETALWSVAETQDAALFHLQNVKTGHHLGSHAWFIHSTCRGSCISLADHDGKVLAPLRDDGGALRAAPRAAKEEPTILASALQATGARWSAQHAEATALRHRLEVLARNLDSGEGEEVDKDWVHRFVTSHQRLVELGCRLEAGFVDIDAELRRLQAVLGHARVLGALAGSGENGPGSRAALPSGAAVFHFGQTPEDDADEGHEAQAAKDLEDDYEALERFAESAEATLRGQPRALASARDRIANEVLGEVLLASGAASTANFRAKSFRGGHAEMYALVFIFRYLDLLWSFISVYNTVMKITYITTTCYLIYLMRYKTPVCQTYERSTDSFQYEIYLLAPCVLLGLICAEEYTIPDILWSSSIWLESVSIIPQLVLLQQIREVEPTGAFYILNWIYRYFAEDYVNIVGWIGGLVQTGLYWNGKMPLEECSEVEEQLFHAGAAAHWVYLPPCVNVAKRTVLRATSSEEAVCRSTATSGRYIQVREKMPRPLHGDAMTEESIAEAYNTLVRNSALWGAETWPVHELWNNMTLHGVTGKQGKLGNLDRGLFLEVVAGGLESMQAAQSKYLSSFALLRGSSCPYCHEHTNRRARGEEPPHRPRKTLRNKIKRQMQQQMNEFDRSPDRVHDEWQMLVHNCPYAWNYLSGLLDRADTAAARATANLEPADDVTTAGPLFTQLEEVLSGEVQLQNGMIFSV
ncbi:ER lumen protein-retaining receptor [Symbiodinium microadriaticum]|uniref:ER lumen protein-retaining receptor n=2 Tax=Symbiodinium TaxID=2949 RepID=A0A1Q9DUB0_SYMMI|nr:ER lumen protein-retaining receptor [Symbiodinium microadriaticum]